METVELLQRSGIGEWLLTLEDKERVTSILVELEDMDFTDFFGRPLGVYDFEVGKGINGILLGTGHFLKCLDRQHGLLSTILTGVEQFQAIYFSSRLVEGDQSVVTHHIDNSMNWGRENFQKAKHLANMGLVAKTAELENKIVITEEQLDFIESHYEYTNESLKKLLHQTILEDTDDVSIFPKDKVSEEYYVIRKY